MKTVTFKPVLSALLVLCIFGAFVGTAYSADARPNVLFFLIDDQRNDTLGCAGHPVIKTPNVDQLAAAGVRFENMFVTTSICAASRASIFTGMTERTHGYTFGKPPVCKKHIAESYGAQLRAAGYRTGHIGKFGVNMEGGRASIAEMFDVFNPLNRHPYLHKMPDGSLRHESERCGDFAEEFIASQPEDKPFCLQVSFNAVHAEDGDKRPGVGHYPWPKAVDGMYEDIPMAPPRLGDPAIFDALPKFMQDSMNRDRWYWRWDTPEKYETNMRAYFRMITGVDRVIGRVLKKLEAEGLADNTIVIYTGDNGYYMGDRGFAGKWSHYEQSLRVPLIIYDPRLPEEKRGRLVEPMSLNIDLPATILDIAGVDVPADYQGHTLMPVVRDEATDAKPRTDFFCEHLMGHAAIPKWEGIRDQRYVYANYFGQNPPQEFLHDLKTDPDQLKNLAADPAMAEVLQKLRARTAELRAKYEAARPER